MRPRLLVTGGSGFLGSAIVRRAVASWQTSFTYCRSQPAAGPGTAFRLDLADPEAIRRVVEAVRPDVVLHSAMGRSAAEHAAVTALGSRELALAVARQGAALLHLSSYMVFDGERAPYDEDAAPAPITLYGRAKAEAEAGVRTAHPHAVVARLSLLYCLDPPDPRAAQVLRDLEAGSPVTFFTDELRCPAEVGDVADALLAAAARLAARASHDARGGLPEVLHLAGPEVMSRWEFGTSFLEALQVPTRGVRASRIADSGLVRPRDLTMVSRRTPRELTAPLRPWAAVLAGRSAIS